MAVSSTDDDQRDDKFLQITVIILATLANFSIGTYLAWTSPIFFINSHRDVLGIGEQDASWICSLVPLGAVLGSLPAEAIATKIGRKRSINIASPIIVVCWLIIGLVANKIWVLLARFVAGLVCGAFSIIIPIYLNEMVDNRYKESLSTICQLQIYLGTLFTYFTGFSDHPLTIALLCALAPTILSVTSIAMPESPVWLMTQNRKEEADEVMKRLKRSEDITEEDTRRFEDDAEQRGCVSEFKAHIKATIIAFSLISIQQMSGVVIFVGYASTIFKYLNFPLSTTVSSIILGLTPVIATYYSKNLLNLLKTKLLLFLSLCVMSVCLFIVSGYFRLQNTFDDVSKHSWLPFLSVMLFMAAYAVGCEPVTRILIRRIFPRDVRNMAIAGSTVCGWISLFVAAKGFQDMTSLMGISTVFAMYGMSTLIGTAFVARMVPETEGKSEEELQMELRAGRQEDNTVPTCC